jgi:hypothetical protein
VGKLDGKVAVITGGSSGMALAGAKLPPPLRARETRMWGPALGRIRSACTLSGFSRSRTESACATCLSCRTSPAAAGYEAGLCVAPACDTPPLKW